METYTTFWGKHKVTLAWVASDTLPTDLSVTSTHGFCFRDNEIAMVNLETRGWDIPGGHMEEGETPEQCFAREAMEEACIAGSAQLLGYILVDNREDEAFDATKYPEVGVQAYYRMDVEKEMPFIKDFESKEVLFFSPDCVPEQHHAWNHLYQGILDAAVSLGK